MKSFLSTLVIALLLPAGAFAADLPASAVTMTEEQQRTLHVTVVAPEPVRAVFGQELPGRVTVPPAQVRVLAAPQSGVLEQMPVAVGDEVVEGQVIARIKSPELVSLQRDFLQALTQQHLAQNELQRDEMLLKEGIIAKRRYEETQSRYAELMAALAERRQILLLAGMVEKDISQLEKDRQLSTGLLLRAPMTGVVLERLAEPGQRLNVSDPVYRIANLDPLWLEISVPLQSLPALSPGAAVRVAAYGAEGQLLAIGREVERASQTVTVRAELTTGAGALRPGQYVQATIAGMPGDDRYQIPSGAVVRSGQHSIVFVQTSTGFAPRIVEVLGTENGKAVILGQFTAEEKIAVTGLAAIKGASMGLGGGE